MTERDMTDPIVKTIEVPCDPATAFAVFAERFDKWWPAQSHSMSAMDGGMPGAVVLEPRAGGAIYEIDPAGARHEWGVLQDYVPGERLAFTWRVGQPEEKATRVEITFAADGAGTRVVLTHSGWQVHGGDAGALRGNYDKGWVAVFEESFGAACAAV